MNNTQQGRVHLIKATQQVSEKFSKRDFVIRTEDQYPQDILFQVTQDKCAILDNFKVGQSVNVHFNLRGREWTDPQGVVKYFNTIEAWRIEALEAQVPQVEEEPNDLPF